MRDSRETGCPVLAALHERLSASRCALLVVDLQNDFCARGGYIERLGKTVEGYRALLEPVGALLHAARAAHVPVAWLRAAYASGDISAAMRSKKLGMGITEDCCVPGSWGYDYFGPRPAEGEPEFDKHSYSGFSHPGLRPWLSRTGVQTVVFCGVQTNVCVESTLRDAHSRGYYVAIAADAVASHTLSLHEATLANVQFLFGDVVSSAEVVSSWSGASIVRQV